MKKPIKELETRVCRTYRGGGVLDSFLGKDRASDSFYPEDWISSFVEAKNRVYVKDEGLTGAVYCGEKKLLRDVVTPEDFGEGRSDSGVLVKLLDSAERLGIQVHPTKKYAREVFDSAYGKTECWHILKTREGGEPACVYMGFKPGITKEAWKKLFDSQDIQGMLGAMHKLEVKPGDTILVTGGTPHAIGAGCFMLEIQEPSDYTMRTEKITVAGEALTPMQIHYGVGEQRMLDCFEYIGMTEDEVRERFFLKQRPDPEKEGLYNLVTYRDTPCFRLDKVEGATYRHKSPEFVTVIVTGGSGELECMGCVEKISHGDKYFIPANTEITLSGVSALVCYPPEIK